MTSLELLRLLLDLDHLAVAGALATRPMSTDELAGHCGMPRRSVLIVVAGLRGAGLVVQDGDRYRIDVEAVRAAARAAAEVDLPMDPAIGFGMTDEERTVLARMFSGRTLTEIPGNRAKRLVLLQRLALEFDVGRRYAEREVNEILFAFHPDWSALRRYLVDEGFLDREHGVDAAGASTNLYWRSGGRVTSAPPTG